MTAIAFEQAPEQQVAFDMIRRSLPAVPVALVLAAIGWRLDGVLSATFAIALVLANFALAATLMARAARISLPFLMAATLIGYPVRLSLLFLAVFLVHGASWFAVVPFGATLVVTHLGLLWWETRFVSLSLAYPGLKPGVGRS